MNEQAMTSTASAADVHAVPVAGSERIGSIDTLRGVAVLGILVMNIYGFAMSFSAYSNPLADGGTEWYNLGTWFFTHVFFDQKFMTIFSMLYGAGLVMMATRAESRGAPYAGVWYRRSIWLLLIGSLHAYLIWFGDILFYYALIGMLVFLFRNLSPKALIVIACLLLPIALLLSYGGGIYMAKLGVSAAEITQLQGAGEELTEQQEQTLEEWDEMSLFLGPPDEQVIKDNNAYRGSYSEIVAYRAPFVVQMQSQAVLFFMIWRVGGLMLLGMALMKLGILSGKRNSDFYRKMLIAGYGLGLPLTIFSAYDLQAHQWNPMYVFKIGVIYNYIGSVFVAFGHIALVMLIVKKSALPRLMTRFTAVGRMAFTNYLMHSIILTTIFYGYGLNLFGQIPRLWQMAFVVAVIALQLIVSPIWLRHFRFGPAEWLWRSLTYWQRQPMVRPSN